MGDVQEDKSIEVFMPKGVCVLIDIDDYSIFKKYPWSATEYGLYYNMKYSGICHRLIDGKRVTAAVKYFGEFACLNEINNNLTKVERSVDSISETY